MTDLSVHFLVYAKFAGSSFITSGRNVRGMLSFVLNEQIIGCVESDLNDLLQSFE